MTDSHTFAERRRTAAQHGLCSQCVQRPREPGRASCRHCLDYAIRKKREYTARGSVRRARQYLPIDEVLANPRIRILRALRRFDEVAANELMHALDVADFDEGNNRDRDRHAQALARLVKQGLVEKETGSPCLYRITDAGRREAEGVMGDYRRRLGAA